MSALLALLLAAPPRLVAPADGAWTTQPTLRFFVDAERDLQLSADGGEASCRLPRGDGGAPVWHCALRFDAGVVSVAVAAGDSGDAGFVFRRSVTTGPLLPGVTFDRLGTAVHAAAVEARCAGCHAPEPAPVDGGAAAPTSCGGCHADVTGRRFTHGPVGQGACLACHQAQSEPRYAVRWPIQDTCFNCHVDVRGTMARRAFRHGPAAAGRCTTCHDPHGSDQPFWLKKRAYELCTNCHTEKRTERHVVVGFVYGDSHPLQGRPHPLKPGVEFACPACHDPHAAQARFLWQFETTQREGLCRTCHAK